MYDMIITNKSYVGIKPFQ